VCSAAIVCVFVWSVPQRIGVTGELQQVGLKPFVFVCVVSHLSNYVILLSSDFGLRSQVGYELTVQITSPIDY
jgi:hypothetical protein